jgi:hypothetical protein
MKAGSLGGGGVAGGGRGVDGCNAKSVPMEMLPSPSSCGMAHIRSVSAPSRLFVGSTGCTATPAFLDINDLKWIDAKYTMKTQKKVQKRAQSRNTRPIFIN